MAKRNYVTAARVQEVGSQLSERDWAVLRDVDRVGVVSGQQLRRLHYEDNEAGRRLARSDLARLVDERVLGRLERRIGGVRAGSDGFVYVLDVLGQRLLRPDRPRARAPWTPGVSHLAHALAVSELYVGLREHRGTWRLVTFDAEPACWRRFTGPGGRTVMLKPDALVIGIGGEYEDRFFVELDRGSEALPRVVEKARVYVRYWQSGREQASAGVFPQVLWVAPDERRQEQIVEALVRLGAAAWPLFVAATSTRAVGLITGEVESRDRVEL